MGFGTLTQKYMKAERPMYINFFFKGKNARLKVKLKHRDEA